MKNLKNIATAIALVAVLTLGTFNANAGLLLSDSAGTSNQCVKTRTFNFGTFNFRTLTGILASGVTGMLLSDKAGMLLSDGLMLSDSNRQTCRQGLLMSDKSGLLLSDKAGMLLSD